MGGGEIKMSIHVEAGDKVIKETTFPGFIELIVKNRSENTITTQHSNGMLWARWDKLNGYKAYDEAKIKKLHDFISQIAKLEGQFQDIYNSLEDIE
jgi:hypothetical protein